MATASVCKIEGCDNPTLARGWCSKHWQRWSKTGDPLGLRQTPPGSTAAYVAEQVIPHVGDECLIWPYGRNKGGYAVMSGDTPKSRLLVHRYVCERVNGAPASPDLVAAHNCGHGHLGCVNPHHVRWATHSANMMDCVEHDTHIRGERHPNVKLTEDMVRAIRRWPNARTVTVAARFNVSPRTIRDVRARRSWDWLD